MRLVVLGYALLLLSLCSGTGFGQQTTLASNCTNWQDYDSVIEKAAAMPVIGLNNGYEIRLSYSQTDRPEVMIRIFHRKPGEIEAVLFTAIEMSITAQIEEIQGLNCKISIDELVSKLRFERRSVKLSESEAETIRRGFFKNVVSSGSIEAESMRQLRKGEVDIVVDAGWFEATFDGTSVIRLAGSGNPISSKRSSTEPEFVDWIRHVYRLIEKVSKEKNRQQSANLNSER